MNEADNRTGTELKNLEIDDTKRARPGFSSFGLVLVCKHKLRTAEANDGKGS